jgi:hypothetical protein
MRQARVVSRGEAGLNMRKMSIYAGMRFVWGGRCAGKKSLATNGNCDIIVLRLRGVSMRCEGSVPGLREQERHFCVLKQFLDSKREVCYGGSIRFRLGN